MTLLAVPDGPAGAPLAFGRPNPPPVISSCTWTVLPAATSVADPGAYVLYVVSGPVATWIV